MLTTPSGHTAEQMVHGIYNEVCELLARKAVAEVEREAADKRHQAILDTFEYFDEDGERITDPHKSWKIADDEKAQEYYNLCDLANIDAGYELEPGYCPALIAEHNVIKAEWALLEAAEKFMPGVTNDKLLCAGLGKREQYIDLLIGMVVNYPGNAPN